MFQGTSNLTTSADPDRLLAPKEYLIIYNWKNHFPRCQKNSLSRQSNFLQLAHLKVF